MSVGYYYSRNKVYYGSYDETVVSGGGLIKAEKMRWLSKDEYINLGYVPKAEYKKWFEEAFDIRFCTENSDQ